TVPLPQCWQAGDGGPPSTLPPSAVQQAHIPGRPLPGAELDDPRAATPAGRRLRQLRIIGREDVFAAMEAGYLRSVPDEVLGRISPSHSDSVNFFGVINVDVEAELASWTAGAPAPGAQLRGLGFS
ncbi:MAG TPA: hypothetical protein VI365_09945, partial [Trebonia sp.]